MTWHFNKKPKQTSRPEKLTKRGKIGLWIVHCSLSRPICQRNPNVPSWLQHLSSSSQGRRRSQQFFSWTNSILVSVGLDSMRTESYQGNLPGRNLSPLVSDWLGSVTFSRPNLHLLPNLTRCPSNLFLFSWRTNIRRKGLYVEDNSTKCRSHNWMKANEWKLLPPSKRRLGMPNVETGRQARGPSCRPLIGSSLLR